MRKGKKRVEKAAKALLREALEIIDGLPEDYVWYRGSEALSKREIISRFGKDDDFAAEIVSYLGGLKLDKLFRREEE